MILGQNKEKNRVEDRIITVENPEETQYIGSPNFSVSGASTSNYYYPQLNVMSNEEMTSRGSSFDVVNRFLYSERAVQSNEEVLKKFLKNSGLHTIASLWI
ncbi:hypothetical protein WA026_013327 [Henosepilachna vigintioctopunctata]|uniref:Uncharacterized protein n=1 Tax=Henosepilachna vigintioctopunctata TaxID=420089 RepID=A0AAW1V6S5_9CUCU